MTLPVIHQHMKVAVDAVIFQVRQNELHVLLIQMTKEPYVNMWAIPGGLLEDDETAIDASKRILQEQTSVTGVHLEQVHAFDALDRDAAGRVISIGHFALIPSGEESLQTTEKYADVRWHPVGKLPKLAYDHNDIIKAAHAKLKRRLAFTNVVWSLLPKEFTLSELQAVYESILGKELDKRNFRRKILSLGMIDSTGKKKKGEAHRPAVLYKFKKRKLDYLNM